MDFLLFLLVLRLTSAAPAMNSYDSCCHPSTFCLPPGFTYYGYLCDFCNYYYNYYFCFNCECCVYDCPYSGSAVYSKPRFYFRTELAEPTKFYELPQDRSTKPIPDYRKRDKAFYPTTTNSLLKQDVRKIRNKGCRKTENYENRDSDLPEYGKNGVLGNTDLFRLVTKEDWNEKQSTSFSPSEFFSTSSAFTSSNETDFLVPSTPRPKSSVRSDSIRNKANNESSDFFDYTKTDASINEATITENDEFNNLSFQSTSNEKADIPKNEASSDGSSTESSASPEIPHHDPYGIKTDFPSGKVTETQITEIYASVGDDESPASSKASNSKPYISMSENKSSVATKDTTPMATANFSGPTISTAMGTTDHAHTLMTEHSFSAEMPTETTEFTLDSLITANTTVTDAMTTSISSAISTITLTANASAATSITTSASMTMAATTVAPPSIAISPSTTTTTTTPAFKSYDEYHPMSLD